MQSWIIKITNEQINWMCTDHPREVDLQQPIKTTSNIGTIDCWSNVSQLHNTNPDRHQRATKTNNCWLGLCFVQCGSTWKKWNRQTALGDLQNWELKQRNSAGHFRFWWTSEVFEGKSLLSEGIRICVVQWDTTWEEWLLKQHKSAKHRSWQTSETFAGKIRWLT